MDDEAKAININGTLKRTEAWTKWETPFGVVMSSMNNMYPNIAKLMNPKTGKTAASRLSVWIVEKSY